jgi:hypothetical protein
MHNEGTEVAPKRFAFYGRLSTTDKQDPALSFPSQRKACERKAAELAGEITCEFTDQESGAKAERPGWTALTAEARDRDGRRFDGVIIYSTSRAWPGIGSTPRCSSASCARSGSRSTTRPAPATHRPPRAA